MHGGYIKLWRSVKDSSLWFENRRGHARVASDLEAWVDLIMLARYADGPVFLKGQRMVLRRGCLLGTLRFLAERWHWSKSRVKGFIKRLELEDRIKTEIVQRMTHVSIVNYRYYQNGQASGEDKDGTGKGQDPDTGRTNKGQIEEGKEGKEGGEGFTPAFVESRTLAEDGAQSSAEQQTLNILVSQFKRKAEWIGSPDVLYRHFREALQYFDDGQLSQGIREHVQPGAKPWDFLEKMQRLRRQHRVTHNKWLCPSCGKKITALIEGRCSDCYYGKGDNA